MTEEINRNAPCPCGSGKKYKRCCMSKKSCSAGRKRSAWVQVLIFALVFGAGAAVTRWLTAPESQAPDPNLELPAGSAQPPGPAPAGKVWSEEHGHWHNAPVRVPQTAPAATPVRQPAAQPPGPVPEGKVWSEEHGHWHSIPGYVGPTKTVSVAAVTGDVVVDEGPTDFEVVEDSAPERP